MSRSQIRDAITTISERRAATTLLMGGVQIADEPPINESRVPHQDGRGTQLPVGSALHTLGGGDSQQAQSVGEHLPGCIVEKQTGAVQIGHRLIALRGHP